MSAGIVDEDGILITNKDTYKRYNISSFLSMDATSWLTTQFDMKYSNSQTSTTMGSFSGGSIWWLAVGGLLPMTPLGKGTLTPNSEDEYDFITPRHFIEQLDPKLNKKSNIRALGRFIVKPLKGWNITGEYAYDRNSNAQREIKKTKKFLHPLAHKLEGPNPQNSYSMQNELQERNVINILV